MPRFGKDKSGRNEELDRQAAEEVERLTRRGGPPSMGGGMGGGGYGGGPSVGMPSPLEMMAAEIADEPRPVQRGARAPRPAASRQQQAFTPMPSGEVGSSFGPGGLNPGPRGGGGAPPPPAFGGGEDYGGHVTGPSVYYNNPTDFDEDEEMSITELALMDHAAHTGHRPEDLVMQYDASSAEEMRDIAMRQFYERQQARRPGAGTSNPFAPAGMRRGPAPSGVPVRRDDPASAGGALAQRLANKRRREEEEARRAAAAEADPGAGSQARAEAEVDEGALSRVLARRRQALGVDRAAAPEPAPEPVAPARRPAGARAAASPGLRAVPTPHLDHDEDDDDAPSLEDMAASTPTRRVASRPAAKAETAKAPAAKVAPAAKAKTAKAPAATKAAKAPATKVAPAAKATKAAPAAKVAKPATKAKAPAATPAGKAKTIFCMECGEKNPAMAKFCFNCGTRLAVPEG